MILTIIVLAYVASVFLNREANRIAYKRDRYMGAIWGLWFLPIMPAIIWGLHILGTIEFKKNWFTGKNW
jgi:hypothetical protein